MAFVMAGQKARSAVSMSDFPAIHVLSSYCQTKTWMPGIKPGMTGAVYFVIAGLDPPMHATLQNRRLVSLDHWVKPDAGGGTGEGREKLPNG